MNSWMHPRWQRGLVAACAERLTEFFFENRLDRFEDASAQ
jgi:hypothetical protein